MKCKNENNESVKMAQGAELIKTPSGKWFSLSENDIQICINDLVQVLSKYIEKGDIICLFIDFDSANLTSIILYHACIICGATVIRCSISDLERQIPIINNMIVDTLVCSAPKLIHIKNKIQYKKFYIVDSIESFEENSLLSGLNIYEFFDIPGILISDCGNIVCPGYNLKYNHNKSVFNLNTKKNIQLFHIVNYIVSTSTSFDNLIRSDTNVVKSFVSLQIQTILFELFNGNIDDRGNIILNSIGMVELLVRIEEEFCVSISMEKISKDSFSKIQNLENLIISTILENTK